MSAAKIHVPGAILAALCLTKGSTGYYHWMIFLCTSHETGEAFHATYENGPNTSWMYQHKSWNALTSDSCIILHPIGRIAEFDPKDKDAYIQNLDDYLRPIPLKVPEVDRGLFSHFTCRVWFRAAIRELHRAGVYVYCPDVNPLEEKLLEAATGMEYLLTERPTGREIQIPVAVAPSPLATPWS